MYKDSRACVSDAEKATLLLINSFCRTKTVSLSLLDLFVRQKTKRVQQTSTFTVAPAVSSCTCSVLHAVSTYTPCLCASAHTRTCHRQASGLKFCSLPARGFVLRGWVCTNCSGKMRTASLRTLPQHRTGKHQGLKKLCSAVRLHILIRKSGFGDKKSQFQIQQLFQVFVCLKREAVHLIKSSCWH